MRLFGKICLVLAYLLFTISVSVWAFGQSVTAGITVLLVILLLTGWMCLEFGEDDDW